MKVVVTRPVQESATWLMALSRAGHEAVYLPLIDVRPTPDRQSLEDAWRGIESFDAVMFVSGNAVRHFFSCKPPDLEIFQAQSAIKTRALVTGPGSLNSLLRLGAQVACIDAPDADAPQFDSEALWKVMGHRVGTGWRVLIVRGAGAPEAASEEGTAGHGRDWFAQQVRTAGGKVDFVVAYERLLPVWSEQQHAEALAAAGNGAVWLITSSEAIGHLQTLCSGVDWTGTRAVVTHPRIAEAARSAGFVQVAESRPALTSVLASIESLQ